MGSAVELPGVGAFTGLRAHPLVRGACAGKLSAFRDDSGLGAFTLSE